MRYSRTKLHHVIWWRHLGRTDLDNLLPVCEQHHQNIHHDGWLLTLTPDRHPDHPIPRRIDHDHRPTQTRRGDEAVLGVVRFEVS